jgi:hypothetical protein
MPKCHNSNAYRTVRSTKALSSFPTSLLKASVSFQQSNGLRSFIRKHWTSSSFAFSTPGSADSNFFLRSNLAFSPAISFDTLPLLSSALRCFSAASPVILSRREGDWSDEGAESCSSDACSAIDLSFSASSAARRSSSEVTRDWILYSRLAERVVSD